MEQIERIKAMEEKLNAALAALSVMENALEAYRCAQADIGDLEAYLAGDEWRQDFDADEKGLLPADLRRGVLSEDGIYNMLEANAALLNALGALTGGASPRPGEDGSAEAGPDEAEQ